MSDTLDARLADAYRKRTSLEMQLTAYRAIAALAPSATPSVEFSAHSAVIHAQAAALEEASQDLRDRLFDLQVSPPSWRERNCAHTASTLSAAAMDRAVQTFKTVVMPVHLARRFPTEPSVLIEAADAAADAVKQLALGSIAQHAELASLRRQADAAKLRAAPVGPEVAATMKAELANALAGVRALRRKLDGHGGDLDRAVAALKDPPGATPPTGAPSSSSASSSSATPALGASQSPTQPAPQTPPPAGSTTTSFPAASADDSADPKPAETPPTNGDAPGAGADAPATAADALPSPPPPRMSAPAPGSAGPDEEVANVVETMPFDDGDDGDEE
eukprot:TRINITY_DN60172_c0_g1_i1.p1 TRINITY_DN60172_c0_g1~~TRINITY_DN60172_c0_g1_i1.p1  ORF type:complete len:333 (-),score=58.48 TRINITY_DN60172_c0_g1_i1:125-1123(-)